MGWDELQAVGRIIYAIKLNYIIGDGHASGGERLIPDPTVRIAVQAAGVMIDTLLEQAPQPDNLWSREKDIAKSIASLGPDYYNLHAFFGEDPCNYSRVAEGLPAGIREVVLRGLEYRPGHAGR
ncbi:hypothetical protein HYY74_02520 [Candidatus Woesearchaeota archaeon]|nr:hypothetical protein [Candidatus Woesearchaeota archaeon]